MCEPAPISEQIARCRAACPLAVAMDKRHPLLPDVPTFRELGVDWVDGAYRGVGVPKSTPPEVKKRIADLWSVYLEKEISPSQVALCLCLVKIARLIETPDHLDSIIDLAAYTAIYGEINDSEK